MLEETVLILSLTVRCCLQTLPRQLVFIIVTMWYLTCSCKLGTVSYREIEGVSHGVPTSLDRSYCAGCQHGRLFLVQLLCALLRLMPGLDLAP